MRTSEVLDLAADTIQERGWTHVGEDWGGGWKVDVWGRDGGPVCIEGAIGAVIGCNPAFMCESVNNCPAGIAVKEYLGIAPWATLYDFNDEPGRTAEEVIEVLRATAAVERAKEESLERVNA